jgi:hypothetical protein
MTPAELASAALVEREELEALGSWSARSDRRLAAGAGDRAGC